VTSSEAIEIDDYVPAPDEESTLDDRSLDEIKHDEQNEDLYNLKDFTV
jgi:hypothetical protein